MAGRPFLFDLRCRNETICRTCLSVVCQRPAQSWRAASAAASYSSRATKSAVRRRIDDGVARKPSKAEFQEYLDRIKSLRSQEKEDAEPFSVRYFEQNDTHRKELRGEEAFDDSMNKLDASELREALEEIRNEMGGKEEQDMFDEVVAQLGDDWDKMKSADDLEKLVARMDAFNALVDAEIDEAGADLPIEMLQELDLAMPGLPSMGTLGSRVAIPKVPEGPFKAAQRRKIAKLNFALGNAARTLRSGASLKAQTVLHVYKAYYTSRLSLAHGWSHVPMDVWDLLWTVLSANESINPHRLAHVALLARDMSDAKVTSSPEQQLLTIEALFVDGWTERAMESWRRSVGSLGDENATSFQEFWELGVHMFCRVRDVEAAERAINKLLQGNYEPRILMTFIRTCSELGTPEGRERAWASYRQMRELLGADMTIEDYDQVISYFLATSQTENALYAFVDMMTLGEIDLKKRSTLPSVIANKFFFGKWLKRLIGAGDLNGALHVVQFMRKSKVSGSPIQLNGLIGAWHRAGGVENLAKADEMAWGMIQSRIDFVKERRELVKNPKKHMDFDGLAALPPATSETFFLLAENYRFRGLHKQLEALWAASREAEIEPDAFMINQLLESYIQSGQSGEALDLYQDMVIERGVAPDPYTFSALWKTLGVNRIKRLAPETMAAEIKRTRKLFAETAKFKDIFLPEGMDGQLARKILHTFRLVQDGAGVVVALTILKDVFKFLPPEALVLEMTLGVASLKWKTPKERQGLVAAKRAIDKQLLNLVGGDASQLVDERRGQVMYQYLQRHFWPKNSNQESMRNKFLEAARQMGVYDLVAPKMTAK